MSAFGQPFAHGAYYRLPQQQADYSPSSLYPLQPISHMSAPSPAASTSSSGSARHRINMACTYCRTRKIRCTGQSPCPNCVRTKRCCVFEEVPDEVNRRTKQRKAQFKALKAQGFPTKSRAAKEVKTCTTTSPAPVAAVQGWAPRSLAPPSGFSTPPRPAVTSQFPSVLTPGPSWTPELEGFSSVNPNASDSPSSPSSSGSVSPTPFPSPLSTPTIMHSAAYRAPRVSLSVGNSSPAFEFDGSDQHMDTYDSRHPTFSYSPFAAAPSSCDMRAYQGFPSVEKRPSVAYQAPPEPQAPVANPGLGFHFPAGFAPDMPRDERFQTSTADDTQSAPAIRVSTEDSWTTPFATICLTDKGPVSTWSFIQ